jgi:hypothetical protein
VIKDSLHIVGPNQLNNLLEMIKKDCHIDLQTKDQGIIPEEEEVVIKFL